MLRDGWLLSDAASGWADPITTRGADYAHHITASPPRFENPAASLSLINDTWKFGKILGQFHCSIIEVFQFAQLFPLVIFNLSSERKSDWIERTIKTQIPCLWDLLAAFLILCLSIAALTSENRLWANCSWVGGAKSTEFWGDFCNQKRRVSQGSLYKWTEHFIKSNSFR